MRSKKQIYMGTTRIDAQRTAAEIVAELVKAGATSVNTDYEDRQINGLRWIMKVGGRDTVFDMPARVDPIAKIIRDRDQATRVAWRQLLRWVQAQNAMIECGMVQAAEVYFAYLVPDGATETVYQRAMSHGLKQLAAGRE
jgi:hypothetical protein